MKKTVLSILALLCTAAAALAQGSIRVEVHNIVELSERFNVVFVVEGENAPSEFSWEAPADFTVVWGPQKGSSSSISIVNGKTTRSSQTSYTYILQAKAAGTFTLGAANATVKGKTISSKPVQIQVLSSSQAPSGGGAPSGQAGTEASASEPLFLKLSLSRNEVVVGEPVTVTLKIYHRTNLVGFENARFPSFNGFWSQEVETPSNIEFQREQLGGTMYNSAVLRRWIIIPQKAGTQSIEAAQIVCLVNEKRRRGGGSFFDDFFENDYITTRQQAVSQSPSLRVSPLPSGAPAGFGGGVGQFSIQARVSRDTLKAHDAASLLVSVSGKGNIALIEAPKINFPPDFEVYDVKTSVNTDKSGTSGTKTFEYPFIPRSHGDFVLNPVKFSWYDVKQRQYKTAASDSLRLRVLKNGNAQAAAQTAGPGLIVERKGVENLSEDIRFIHTDTRLHSPRPLFIARPAYWIAVLAEVLAALALALGLRRRAARRSDVAGTRKRKATRMALKRLAQAREFLQKDLYTAFYEELHRSLLGFAGDKLSMNLAQQNKENIAEQLLARGVPENLTAEYSALLDACEYARYAPDAGHEAMDAHYRQALNLITSIDSSMKKAPDTSKAATLLSLVLLLAGFGASAQTAALPDSLWNTAVQSYTEGDFQGALEQWRSIDGMSVQSPELAYNMGNAFFKSGEIAPAILWWERALLLDPSDADTRHNLEYARSLTQDRIDEVPELFFKQWARSLCYIMKADTWAILGLVLLGLCLALALLFRLGDSRRARSAGFFGGIAALVLALVCWNSARLQWADSTRRDKAIVMRPVASVKSSPAAEGAKDLFILHEGTKVKVLEQIGSFSSVRLADGREGWISNRDIERI